MKYSEYLRDKSYAISVSAAAMVIALIFMKAFKVSSQMITAAVIIFVIAFFAITIPEYLKKKIFYERTESSLNDLDQKYLIAEMIEKPDFYDGKKLYDILVQTDKSMCENVSEHRRKYSDFREFIEMWVHEIKLPLSSLTLMVHNNRNEADDRYAEQLRKIDSYIDTVLYYSRSGSSEKDYIIKTISLKKTVYDIIRKYREDILLHNVSLNVDIPDISAVTDSKWLEFITGQIIANSLKYISPDRDPEISVYAERSDRKTRLVIRDNGIGISAADLPYIFDKSFTGENGRNGARSTGMGLYICRKLCEKLGHSIEAESVQNEYTQITISFAENDFYTMSES